MHYYVSLGDSLAAGTQPDRPYTDEGYANQLYAGLRGATSKLRLVKLGCPGETTVTMVFGGLSHCRYPHGTQLAEAVSFLHAHRQAISLVTIDLGANDLLPCTQSLAPACIASALGDIQANLPAILAALRAAAGPDIPIVGMNYYNPFLAFWFSSPAAARASNGLVVGQVTPLLEAIYGAAGSPVADVETAFSTTNFTLVGGVPLNVGRICQWTWMCTVQSIHPNATGYGVIASAFAAAL